MAGMGIITNMQQNKLKVCGFALRVFPRPGQLSETAGNNMETNSLTSLALPGHVLTRKKKQVKPQKSTET